MQIERVQHQAKLLYEDLVKTMIRIFPFNDLEIVLANYLIEKAKMNDQAKEEEDISIEININPQQMKESLRKLEKYRITECFEIKIRKQLQESNENTRRKYYKFWRINNNIKKDLEIIMKYVQDNFDQSFKKNKNKCFYVCTNPKCLKKYTLDQSYMYRQICQEQVCQFTLQIQQINQEDLQKLQDEEKQLKEIFQKIRSILEQIDTIEWPFEQNIEQYEYNPEQQIQSPKQKKQLQYDNKVKQIQQEKQITSSQKLKYLRTYYKIDIDLSIESLLKLNLDYQTFVHLKNKIGNN